MMKFTLVWAALVLVGCSSGTVSEDTVVSDQSVSHDAQGEVHFDEVALPDVVSKETDTVAADVLPDFAEPDESVNPACLPGEGCFGDACQDNSQCLSGWCVQHMGDAVCTLLCQEECPAGWQCKAVEIGPDVVSICVSKHSNLCKPCADSGDCIAPGGAADVCVSYGEEGSFCGGLCEVHEDCPWGFACQQATTVEGVQGTQCVAETGVCPCTGRSIALGLSTPCVLAGEHGECAGKRVCTAEGLSACDAQTPALELCNGADDDCDGEVDNPQLVDGEYVSLCDDGNDCTQDVCGGPEGCENLPLEAGQCGDGNPCTVADHCVAGVCLGDPVLCDDENPCTDNMCTENGGCEYPANVVDCDDGNPCTVGDECTDSVCLGVEVPCDCLDDEDCQALEDGDVCNGTLICSIVSLPQVCVVQPETVVTCPQPEGLGHECLEPTCNPDSGECGFAPDNDGSLCDYQDACLLGTVCLDGQCQGGQLVNCNDGNPCTDDSCDPDSGCLNVPNQADCDDQDACTTSDTCIDGVCGGLDPVNCDDQNVCTGDSCQSASGCLHEPLSAQCNDGNACTKSDTCLEGVCVAGAPVSCDDSNPCTADGCSPAQGCSNVPTQAPCSDGDPCTVGEACNGGACVGGVAQDCDDGNSCTKDYCDSAGKCIHAPLSGDCDDGNACTAGDHCVGGVCIFDGPTDCDDDNACSTDACDPVTGCHYTLNEDPCNDGDLCTVNDHCHLGDCIGGAELVCNDGNLCTDDACLPDAGCTFTPNQDACDDGSICSVGDQCAGGWCVPGPMKECNDQDLCTDDYCDAQAGCQNEFNTAPCDDGDACTVGDACLQGQCDSGEAKDCDDGKQCTTDSCHPLLGCVNDPIVGACDDGNACTEGDNCSEGLCIPGPDLPCDDQNDCTDDSCDVLAGCQFDPNQLLCDDEDQCTSADQCANGACGGQAVDCDDLNECTDDSCDPGLGCQNLPVEPGTVCEGDKVCLNGQCVDCGQVTGEVNFDYTGVAQTFVVPDCIEQVTIEAWGAQGGNNPVGVGIGGKGGYAKGALAVNPGDTLHVYVGGHPGTGKPGGFNGGGTGPGGGSTGGGGASDIRVGGTTINERILVAGGGGGAAYESAWSGGWGVGNGACSGGHGGGTEGEKGGYWQGACQGGNGGTQGSGGAHGGTFGQGGPGNMGPGDTGGGGGGWYGGGGGGACTGFNGCGGGGSSFTGGVSGGQTQAGVQTGNGKVVISW